MGAFACLLGCYPPLETCPEGEPGGLKLLLDVQTMHLERVVEEEKACAGGPIVALTDPPFYSHIIIEIRMLIFTSNTSMWSAQNAWTAIQCKTILRLNASLMEARETLPIQQLDYLSRAPQEWEACCIFLYEPS